MKKRLTLLVPVAFMVLFLGACSVNSSQTKNGTSSAAGSDYFKIDDQGMLTRPVDYRSWVYVGTPTTPNDMNNGKAPFPEFHNVYIDPMSYEYWKETGSWREGTILVKELVSVGSKAAVSGNGYFMGDFIGLEATIKSSKYFPNEPGNWSYFSFTSPEDGILKDKAKAFATQDCNACHNANAGDDFVFTQHYPVLASAKAIGGGVIPENAARRTKIVPVAMQQEVDIWAPTAKTPENTNFGIPLDKSGLFEYLKAGKYKAFKNQESKTHSSLGPHTKLGLPVKVFMNDIIANSLKAGNKEHPKGSIIVKEMFDASNTLKGWAVMVKTDNATGQNGKGWFWYEITSPTDMNSIAALGNGVIGCFACHKVGPDMVRSTFPLE